MCHQPHNWIQRIDARQRLVATFKRQTGLVLALRPVDLLSGLLGRRDHREKSQENSPSQSTKSDGQESRGPEPRPFARFGSESFHLQ